MRGRGPGAEVLALVNEQRRQEGRRTLRPSKRLRLAARAHAVDMAKRRYLAHDSLSGMPWWRRVERFVGRRGFKTLGENVARGQDSAGEVVIAWMRSPAHRENILNPQFTHMGVAVKNGDRGPYWCQEFGGR